MRKSLLGLIGCSVLLGACTTVPTGYRGIETRFGKLVGEPLSEGLYFYNPLTTNIVMLSVQEQKWENTTDAYTRDVQQASIGFAMTYYPARDTIHNLYRDVGKNWAQTLLPQLIMGKLKAIVGQYEAVELVAKRMEATKKIDELIRTEAADKGIVVAKFEITNIDFAKQFEEAVEAKVVAIQKAEEARNETVRFQERATQQIITAKAEAESMRIRTDALSANKGLVEYEAVQKWNGVLPQYMMGSSVPFVSLPTGK